MSVAARPASSNLAERLCRVVLPAGIRVAQLLAVVLVVSWAGGGGPDGLFRLVEGLVFTALAGLVFAWLLVGLIWIVLWSVLVPFTYLCRDPRRRSRLQEAIKGPLAVLVGWATVAVMLDANGALHPAVDTTVEAMAVVGGMVVAVAAVVLGGELAVGWLRGESAAETLGRLPPVPGPPATAPRPVIGGRRPAWAGLDWEGPSPEPAETHWTPTPPIAWRGWSFDGERLHGLRVAWPGPELEAVCDAGCDPVPGWGCSCGIYATKDPGLAWSEQVLGLVELEGRVVEHEDGYRASRARIVELWAPRHLVDRLQDRYPEIRVGERKEAGL